MILDPYFPVKLYCMLMVTVFFRDIFYYFFQQLKLFFIIEFGFIVNRFLMSQPTGIISGFWKKADKNSRFSLSPAYSASDNSVSGVPVCGSFLYL